MKKIFLIIVLFLFSLNVVWAAISTNNRISIKANYNGTINVTIRNQPEQHLFLPFANIVFFDAMEAEIGFAPLYSSKFRPLYNLNQQFMGEFVAENVNVVKLSNNIINFENAQYIPFDKSEYIEEQIGQNNKSKDRQKFIYYSNSNNKDCYLELEVFNDKVKLSSIGSWGSFRENPIVVAVFYNKNNQPVAFTPYYGHSLTEVKSNYYSSEFTEPEKLRFGGIKKWEFVNFVILNDFGDI